jgi:hypothetical protein
MTSLRRRRRKKAEKKHRIGRRYEHYGAYEPTQFSAFRYEDHPLVSELRVAIQSHLHLDGIQLKQTAGGESIVFGTKKAALVYVFADEAVATHGGRRISGGFRGPGEHWSELRSLLLELQGARGSVAEMPDLPRVVDEFPSFLPAELTSAAVEASARIRDDLCVFPCPVVLESAPYHVRFERIRRHPRLLVPFSLQHADGLGVTAALDLTSTSDQIAVAFADAADETQVVEAWPVALLAFAELIGTQIAPSREEAKARAHQERTRPADPARAKSPGRRPRRTTNRESRLARSSPSLKPIGETANHQGSFVVGHRRRLPPGQTCHDDARAAARLYAIELEPGLTWVQPHERGTPEGFVLRYAWQAPPQLVQLTGLGSA